MDVFKIEIQNRVAKVQMNRPNKKNALNSLVFKELKEIFSSPIEADAILLTGYRDDKEAFFSSGIDLEELGKIALTSQEDEIEKTLKSFQEAITSIEKCPKPVIALVQGYCYGSALEVALACDLIVSDKMTSFGMFETKLGIIPDLGGTTRLVQRVGPSSAKRIIYLADIISAQEAYHMGLIDWLLDPVAVDKEIQNILQKLLQSSPLALTAAKRTIEKIYNSELEQNLNYEKEAQMRLITGSDVKDRVLNFQKSRGK